MKGENKWKIFATGLFVSVMSMSCVAAVYGQGSDTLFVDGVIGGEGAGKGKERCPDKYWDTLNGICCPKGTKKVFYHDSNGESDFKCTTMSGNPVSNEDAQKGLPGYYLEGENDPMPTGYLKKLK